LKGIWYGDRRDRVKWGGLVYLARSFRVTHIVHISYFSEGGLPELEVDGRREPLAEEVWSHFSDLKNINRLAKKVNLKVEPISTLFCPGERDRYVQEVIAKLDEMPRPLIAFCDPDTGIAPGKPKPEHVGEEDLKRFWQSLERGDILAVYQHAHRKKGWLEPRRQIMARAVGTDVQAITGASIAQDVALLWARKGKRRLTPPIDFSGRFDSIKHQFSRGADPQTVLTGVYPDGIKRYPELFEDFRLHKQEALAIARDDPSLLTDNSDLQEATDLSGASTFSDASDEGIIDVLRDILWGCSASPVCLILYD